MWNIHCTSQVTRHNENNIYPDVIFCISRSVIKHYSFSKYFAEVLGIDCHILRYSVLKYHFVRIRKYNEHELPSTLGNAGLLVEPTSLKPS